MILISDFTDNILSFRRENMPSHFKFKECEYLRNILPSLHDPELDLCISFRLPAGFQILERKIRNR